MDKNLRLAALTLMCSLVVASCGGGGSDAASAPPPPPSDRPASVERNLSPVAIDPLVDTSTEPHVAINPSASIAPAGKLFVFLPGTSGVPDYYRLILRSGASRGFHTLGLSYPNAEAVGVTCAFKNTSCFWDVRREVITGTDYSALVAVNNANSIVTRLTNAITHLNDTYPTEGWGQYLTSGAVNWSKVIVAGHSQGGGHAGVMTKLYSMARAVYFSSPPDWSLPDNAPASWTAAANLTPTSNQYAFGNVNDTFVPYGELSAIWQSMGLTTLGAAVSVDTNAAPYGNTRLLTTSVAGTGNRTSPTHGSTVLDVATPLNSAGVPLFDSVWAYLCFQ